MIVINSAGLKLKNLSPTKFPILGHYGMCYYDEMDILGSFAFWRDLLHGDGLDNSTDDILLL